MNGESTNPAIIYRPPQPLGGSVWEWLFVYGTLKRRQRNHALLNGAPFGGEARVDGMRLYDLGPYPMAIEEAGFQIEGELFGMDARKLAELDRFEGAPRLYERILWPITLTSCAPWDGESERPPNGQMVAWLYRGRARQVRRVAPIGPRYEPLLTSP